MTPFATTPVLASATAVADLLAAGSLLLGLFFMFVGAVGVVRLPDAYHRLHAASKCATLGLTGMLLAACLHLADPATVAKAAATVVFMFVAAPIGSHLIAKAAHHGKLPSWNETLSDDLAADKADPRTSADDDEIGCPDGGSGDLTNAPEDTDSGAGLCLGAA